MERYFAGGAASTSAPARPATASTTPAPALQGSGGCQATFVIDAKGVVHIGLVGCDCAELILSVRSGKGKPPLERRFHIDGEHSAVSLSDLGLTAWDPARVTVIGCTPCPRRRPDWLK